MVVVLPRAHDGLPALEAKLELAAIDRLCAKLKHTKTRLQLPRFEFTSDIELRRVLAAMGMTDAFDETRADFTSMSKEKRLFIAAALHKAFISVDEEGTEAAAATVVMMGITSAPRPSEPVPFVADHPFLFFIRHSESGCSRFAGRVATPKAG